MIHELTHVFQHIDNEGKKQKHYEEYLDNPHEQEAFSVQLEYQEDREKNVVKYLRDLMKYHKIPKRKEEDILNKLTENVDDPKVVDEVLDD